MIALKHPRTWPAWDIMFPPVCDYCGESLSEEDVLFCAQCWANAPVVDPKDLPKPRHLDQVTAAFYYSDGGFMQRVIQSLKYDGMTTLSDVLSRHVLARMPRRLTKPDLYWTPVPQHWIRRMERSFNQSELLTRSLSRTLSRPATIPLLTRTRNTPTQTARTFHERSVNVRNAFAIRRINEVPESVLLIDDVLTTGATVNECARVLKQSGVAWVGVFVFSLSAKTRKGT